MNDLKVGGFRVLKFLERYTKTDMIYLTRGSFWLGLGQVVASGSALLTSIAFANLLSPDTFGIYKYILSIAGMLSITTLNGIDSAVTQSIARGFDGTLNVGLKTKIKWGTIGSLLSLIVAIYYFSQGNLTFAISFCVVALFMPFNESSDIYNALLFGKKLFNVQTYYNVIKKIIALVAIISTLFLTQNIYVILFVYFISILIPNLFLLYRTEKIHKKNSSIDPEAISYGKHLSLIGFISLILSELDKILVFQYVGAVDLAIYVLATAPTDQIKGLLKTVNSLALPQFSQRSPVEIKKTIWHKVWILGSITGLIVLCYILITPIFFNTFFPKYLSSIFYSQILSISLIPNAIAIFLYTVLQSQKASKALYQWNIYGNIFNLIILFPLIYYWGIIGAVLAKTLSRLFLVTLSFLLVKKL